MIRRHLFGLLMRLLILATPPALIAVTGNASPAPLPVCALELRATAVNDRKCGGVICHGDIVLVGQVVLAG